MSGPEKQKPDDAMLEEFLAGNSEVSQAYRAVAKDVPPAELDSAVVDFARREATRTPAPGRLRRARMWERSRWPLAAAAMFILSFNVLVAIRHDRDAREATLLEAPPPPVAPMVVEPAPSTVTSEPMAGAAADGFVESEADAAAPAAPPPAPPRPAQSAAQERRPAAPAAARTPAPVIAAPAESFGAVASPPPASPEQPQAFPMDAPSAAVEERSSAERQRMQRNAMESQRLEQGAAAKSLGEDQYREAKRKAEDQRKSSTADRGSTGAEVQAFLDRPGIRHQNQPAVALEDVRQLIRPGVRQADGGCGFASPPQLESQGELTLIERQLAIDPATCEALVERGYLRQ